MTRKNFTRKELVQAWLEAQRHWWALEVVDDLQRENPAEAWSVILDLVEAAESDELIENVGSGPLEDFVKKYADEYIAEFEVLAGKSSRFRTALACVNINPKDSRVSERLVAIGCTVPPCYQ